MRYLTLLGIPLILVSSYVTLAQELITTQPASQPTTRPATRPGEVTPEIVIDFSQTPELEAWCENELRPALIKWYPLIVADLPSNGFTPPQKFTVRIDSNYTGVAATGGTGIVVSPKWIKDQMVRLPWNEAVGSVIHEEVHVIQQYGYGGRRGAARNPVWLVEGIADYIRWFKYEPVDKRPHPRPTKARGVPASYTDSYRTTAAFLNWVADKHDHEIVVKLNASLRESRYRPELWTLYTGKTIDELWAEYAMTL